MGTKALVLVLKANVGQVHHDVVVVEVVSFARGSQIALVEKVDVEVGCRFLHVHQCPHPDVEFALTVEQRPLDVLLDDPLRVGRLLFYVLLDVSNFRENLYAPALIKCSRFQNPLIVLAVLFRNRLVNRQPLANVQIGESLFKLLHVAARARGEDESGGQHVGELNEVVCPDEFLDFLINTCKSNFYFFIRIFFFFFDLLVGLLILFEIGGPVHVGH